MQMRRILHIALLLLLALACQGPRTIPRDDMEEILYQMLLQDQYIKLERRIQRQADTSLVYEGIFREYGYNTDDFLHSLSVYLEDPSKMEKMMGAVGERLEAETQLVRGEVDLRNWRSKMMQIYRLRMDTTHFPKQRARAVDTLRVRFSDDSVWLYTPVDSLKLIPRDSLLFLLFLPDSLSAPADTLLQQADSLLQQADSLIVTD